MAAALFKKLLHDVKASDKIEVLSYGIAAIEGQPASANAIEVMKMQGIDLGNHKAKLFTQSASEADLILTMTQGHKDFIVNKFPKTKGKVFLLGEFTDDNMEITDPFGQQINAYDKVAEEIKQRLHQVIEKLTELDNNHQ